MLPWLFAFCALVIATPVLAEDGNALPSHQRTPTSEQHLTDQGRWMVQGSVSGSYSNAEPTASLFAYPKWSVGGFPSVTCFLRPGIGIGLTGGGGAKRTLTFAADARSRFGGWVYRRYSICA